jgi:hypothetical protein
VTAAHRAAEHRRSFAVVVGTRAVHRVLALSGVDREITTCGSVADAVHGFHETPPVRGSS